MFKRVVEWADGWMPSLPSLEELEHGRTAIDDLAAKAGRDPASIEIHAFGRPGQFQDRESIKDAERAGASRVTVWLEVPEGGSALAEIEKMSRRLLY